MILISFVLLYLTALFSFCSFPLFDHFYFSSSLVKLEAVSPADMAVVVGGLADVEAMVSLKDLFNQVGCENVYTEEVFPMSDGGPGADLRSSYLLNSSITGIEVREMHVLLRMSTGVGRLYVRVAIAQKYHLYMYHRLDGKFSRKKIHFKFLHTANMILITPVHSESTAHSNDIIL